jgi:hypothetical protein
MECVEDEFFSTDYHNPDSRSIGNALTITLNDGTVLDEVEILYPVGHKRCVFAHLLLFIRVSAKISCFAAAERKVPHC